MLQKIKNNFIYGFIRGLLWGIRWLPLGWARAIGAGLGNLFGRVVSHERGKAVRNLTLAFPEMTANQRQRLALRVFAAMGQSAMELAKMFSYSSRQILSLVKSVEGREHMEAARRQGRGVLCLTAHLGNWEILPIFTQHQGWPTAVVAQSLYDGRLDALLNGFRQSQGVLVIKRQQVTRDIIRCLKNNMLLGMLNDQDTRVDSQWAPFFGQMAKTPVGIIRLARKYRVPVVPVFIVRQSQGQQMIYIEPALTMPKTEDETRDLAEGAKQCNQVIEKYIRRFPEQWVWFHDRWKSKPPAPGAAAETVNA